MLKVPVSEVMTLGNVRAKPGVHSQYQNYN